MTLGCHGLSPALSGLDLLITPSMSPGLCSLPPWSLGRCWGIASPAKPCTPAVSPQTDSLPGQLVVSYAVRSCHTAPWTPLSPPYLPPAPARWPSPPRPALSTSPGPLPLPGARRRTPPPARTQHTGCPVSLCPLLWQPGARDRPAPSRSSQMPLWRGGPLCSPAPWLATTAPAGPRTPGPAALRARTPRGGFLEVPPLWKGVVESPRS